MSRSSATSRHKTKTKATLSQSLADRTKDRVEAEAREIDDNTARLKALRLAKEAADRLGEVSK